MMNLLSSHCRHVESVALPAGSGEAELTVTVYDTLPGLNDDDALLSRYSMISKTPFAAKSAASNTHAEAAEASSRDEWHDEEREPALKMRVANALQESDEYGQRDAEFLKSNIAEVPSGVGSRGFVLVMVGVVGFYQL